MILGVIWCNIKIKTKKFDKSRRIFNSGISQAMIIWPYHEKHLAIIPIIIK